VSKLLACVHCANVAGARELSLFLLYALVRRRLHEGRPLPLLAVLYSLVRFGLDFLRAGAHYPYPDARYFRLTPAQYVCGILFPWGTWKLFRPEGWTRSATPAPPA